MAYERSPSIMSDRSESPDQSSTLDSDESGAFDVDDFAALVISIEDLALPEPKGNASWLNDFDADFPSKRTHPSHWPKRRSVAPQLTHSRSRSFHTRAGSQLASIPQSPLSATEPDERIAWLTNSPTTPPPQIPLPPIPIHQTSFLNRIPKPIIADDEETRTLPTFVTRAAEIPPLRPYSKRPSTAPSRSQPESHETSKNTSTSCRLSLLPASVGTHKADVRRRSAKSTSDSSDSASLHQKDSFMDWDTKDRKSVVSPLAFLRMRTTSQVSLSPPVTGSIMTNESMPSFMIHGDLFDEPEGLMGKNVKKERRSTFWRSQSLSKEKSRSHFDMGIEYTKESQPSQLLALWSTGSSSETTPSNSPLKLEVKLEDVGIEMVGEKEEEKEKQLPKAHKHRSVRRVWKTLVGRL